MVMVPDYWRSSSQDNDRDYERDDAPCKDDLRRVIQRMSLEGTDNEEDEPCDARCGTARVDAADMLYKAREEYPQP